MKTVFFMGAGFSAFFGLPTMNQFLSEVATTNRILEEDKQFIQGLILDARRANSILESSPTNLEDILSFTVMGDRLGLFDDELKTPRVKQILHRIYSSTKYFNIFWDKFKQFEVFINIKPSDVKNEVSFITTNYDLMIECILFYYSLYTKLPIEYEVTYDSSGTTLYHETGIPLYKLHGSLNWFEGDNEEILIDDKLVKLSMNPGERQDLPAQYNDGYQMPGNTLIIPPTFLKPDLSKELAKNWQGAAESINRAESLIFVGYSFPPSDVEMRYFLAKSLENNAVLRNIRIVDPNADKICMRLKDASSGFGSHFKDFLEPINSKWQETKINL